MQNEIREFPCENGELLRVQLVRPESWEQLDFLRPCATPPVFESFDRVYRKFLIPGCPWVFGSVVLFRLPEELPPLPTRFGRYGTVSDPLTATAAVLRRGARLIGTKPVFFTRCAKKLWQLLEAQDCLRIIRGKLPITTYSPVGCGSGYLSETEPDAALKMNASFFIMDPFDCATVYDHVGTAFGLCVKDGDVQSPPLFDREALLVKNDGSVTVQRCDIRSLGIETGGTVYRHGANAAVYTRPECRRASRCRGVQLVITGCRVAAVCPKGRAPVPAGGFVLEVTGPCAAKAGDAVIYRGLEDIRFGIQVGNSIVKDGVPTQQFISRFYNIRKLEKTPYPPSLYPMNFDGARAARMAIGADRDGRPMLLWAEGAGKLSYTPGRDSRGASLADMARVCSETGMHNAVNLDGGGSAQILLHGERRLRISDRKPDNSDAERPVPLGLIVR